jgi:hypothetical protein
MGDSQISKCSQERQQQQPLERPVLVQHKHDDRQLGNQHEVDLDPPHPHHNRSPWGDPPELALRDPSKLPLGKTSKLGPLGDSSKLGNGWRLGPVLAGALAEPCLGSCVGREPLGVQGPWVNEVDLGALEGGALVPQWEGAAETDSSGFVNSLRVLLLFPFCALYNLNSSFAFP